MAANRFQHLRLLAAAAFLSTLAACAAPQIRTAQLDAVATSQHAATSQPAAAANFVNVHALIIVRHADVSAAQKAAMGNATPLLERGQQRALELAYALKDAGITRILTSEALRTRQTAEVLAKELHITPEIPSQKSPFMMGNGRKLENSTVVGYLAQHAKPTDVVLVVYHHSVIPSILQELSYADEPLIDENEYDRLYLVLPDPANHTYHVLRLRYGGKWKPL